MNTFILEATTLIGVLMGVKAEIIFFPSYSAPAAFGSFPYRKLQLQDFATATATATPDPSHISVLN